MTGSEHYRRAEACMDSAEQVVKANEGKRMTQHDAEMLRADIAARLAAAQVHATLALAAATIAGGNADWRDALAATA